MEIEVRPPRVRGRVKGVNRRQIASAATEDTEQEWLRTVPWYTAPDFARLVELASRGELVLQIAAEVADKFSR